MNFDISDNTYDITKYETYDRTDHRYIQGNPCSLQEHARILFGKKCHLYLDDNDKFVGDEEMTNVCIATRKDDTARRDEIQKAMDAIGWNDKAEMDKTMEEAVSLQPAAN